ncbi:MAG TPA: universal stress protein [Ktedonobacteraceae bacterium]|nr:universal stress protein [Ktedonobacteraceae bacterium]
MRVLCCLDGTNVEQISKAISTMLQPEARTIGLLYVIDSGPHGEMERQRERFLRPPHPPLARREQMRQAEVASAQDILEEGTRYLPGAEQLQREGHPEREIVQCATDWSADLVVICPRSPKNPGPASGPKSVGHVARFVLDHAPCPVLLVRSTGGTSLA